MGNSRSHAQTGTLSSPVKSAEIVDDAANADPDPTNDLLHLRLFGSGAGSRCADNTTEPAGSGSACPVQGSDRRSRVRRTVLVRKSNQTRADDEKHRSEDASCHGVDRLTRLRQIV